MKQRHWLALPLGAFLLFSSFTPIWAAPTKKITPSAQVCTTLNTILPKLMNQMYHCMDSRCIAYVVKNQRTCKKYKKIAMKTLRKLKVKRRSLWYVYSLCKENGHYHRFVYNSTLFYRTLNLYKVRTKPKRLPLSCKK